MKIKNLKMKLLMFILILTDTKLMKYQGVENVSNEKNEYIMNENLEEIDMIKDTLEEKASWKYELVWKKWMYEGVNSPEDYSWIMGKLNHEKMKYVHGMENTHGCVQGVRVHVQIYVHGHVHGAHEHGVHELLKSNNICQNIKRKVHDKWQDDSILLKDSLIRHERLQYTRLSQMKFLNRKMKLRYMWRKSKKRINKEEHIKNGNLKNNIKILHWNLGNKHWKRKINEIELLVNERKPDIVLISEAYIFTENEKF